MSRTYIGLLVVVSCGLVGCGRGTNSPSAGPSKLATQASQAPTTEESRLMSSTAAQHVAASGPAAPAAPEVYRQVSREDGIRFYSRASSEELLGDGTLHEEGFECGVIGDDGKEIGIALVSTTVDRGLIRTKDIGILKTKSGGPMANRLLATEGQIKKLRALQSSNQ